MRTMLGLSWVRESIAVNTFDERTRRRSLNFFARHLSKASASPMLSIKKSLC